MATEERDELSQPRTPQPPVATEVELSLPASGLGTPVRFAGIEGLRGLAAVSVVVYHCWLYAADASLGIAVADAAVRHLAAGVLLFFTLSGLLLYRPYAAAIVGARPYPSLRSYAQNRFLRIAPAYWLVFVVVSLVLGAAIVPGGERLLTIGYLTDPAAFAANAALVQGYHPSTFSTGIGPAWTLIVEIAFYAALPLASGVAFAVAKRADGRLRTLLGLGPPAAFLVLGMTGKVVAVVVLDGGDRWARTWGGVLAHSFLANADLFAFGMVVALVSVLHGEGRLRLPRWWRGAALAVGGALFAVAFSIPSGALGNFRYDALVAAGSAFVVAVLVVGPRPRRDLVHRALETRTMVAVGLASYSLYLWHEPLIHWFDRHGILRGTGVGALAFALVVVGATAGGLSALTYRLVEKPALERRNRGPGRRAGHA